MSHDEIRKYIILVIALGLLIAGIILLTTNLPSEGSIDITTPLLSGKVTSGNVGILLIFLSIVLFAIILGTRRYSSNNIAMNAISKQSRFIQRLIAVILGWALEIGTIYFAIYFRDNNNQTLKFLFTFVALWGGFGIIFATITFISRTFNSD